MLCAFRTFCNSWKSFLYTHTVVVVIIGPYTFWKQDSQSHRRTYKHHWRACRSSTLYAVSTSNPSNRIMVQWIQLLASSIVPTVQWYYDENQFAFLHLQLQGFSVSARDLCNQTLSPCGWGLDMGLCVHQFIFTNKGTYMWRHILLTVVR